MSGRKVLVTIAPGATRQMIGLPSASATVRPEFALG